MNQKATGPILEFNDHVEELTQGLSAIVLVGEELWVASDELTSVERLAPGSNGDVFASQRSYEINISKGGPLKLPAVGKKKPDGKEVDQEIDIEGMDFDGGYLWLVGSHSIKRKNVSVKNSRHDPDEKNIDKLNKTDAFGNRFLLARVPIVRDGQTGDSVLAATSPDKALNAAQLPCTMTDNALTRAILESGGKPDPHLSPWLSLPGKDNGFDIEGIAVSGQRVFLGLRGPVLRGWAVVLELHIEEAGAGDLGLRKIGSEGRAYRKHFLNLGGLGVRDLCADGDDLLVLAGPTMTQDGPVRVFRWKGGVAESGDSVVWPDEFGSPALTIPHGEGIDRAEGMTLAPGGNILVVYDAPSDERMVGNNAVRADIFSLP